MVGQCGTRFAGTHIGERAHAINGFAGSASGDQNSFHRFLWLSDPFFDFRSMAGSGSIRRPAPMFATGQGAKILGV
jgi:hypothetical protein